MTHNCFTRLHSVNSRLKMDVWNLFRIDSRFKSFQNFDSNQLTAQKAFKNLDSNQPMTQWCYSFPVRLTFFFIIQLYCWLGMTFFGFSTLLNSCSFLSFRLKYLPDNLMWISSWPSSSSIWETWVDSTHYSIRRLFQESTQNQLMTQVDSQVFIQIDSWLRRIPDFSIHIDSWLKPKTFDSESTHDSTLSHTHVWRWALWYFL